MPSLAVARASNAKFSPKFVPVAVFVGGTSGIGRAMAENFARLTEGNAHIIICGRNRAAAEAIIASFPKPTVKSKSGPLHEFVHCDARLMRNVHQTTRDLLSRLRKINYLVLSPGILSLQGRTETSERIDLKLAVHYYARFKFISDLLPLLKKSLKNGEDAKVMSVLGAGSGGKIELQNLGLHWEYNVMDAALAAPTYNDLMLEEFAARQPEIAFTHIHPGIVRTPLLNFFKIWILDFILFLILYLFSISAEDASEYMLYGLFQGEKGFFRRGRKGDDIGMEKYYGSDEAREKLWEHTVKATSVA